jgi:anionic cell wall polymer biosynthesis LytR-Cps2A-Psr (LCP) family protein
MKKNLLYPILAGVFILGFGITYFVLSKVGIKKAAVSPTPNSFALATPKPINEVVPEKGVYNILFLGYGGAGHDGSLLTDSIIVIHVDTNTKKVAFISVPRDLWITGGHKINSVGATNGFENVGPAITGITGLPINYYVSADFGGFSKIIDDLGGITVQVPVTLDDPFYPIIGQENNTCGMTPDQINALKAKYSGYQLETQFTCRYEHLHFDKGPANLDGVTALKFVRSRHGDSDFARSLRQFAVLTGIENKLISFQAANKFDDIVGTLFTIVKTNLDAGTVKTLVQVFGNPKDYTTKQIQLTTDNVLNQGTSSDGQYILTPKAGNFDFSGVKSYISDNI